MLIVNLLDGHFRNLGSFWGSSKFNVRVYSNKAVMNAKWKNEMKINVNVI